MDEEFLRRVGLPANFFEVSLEAQTAALRAPGTLDAASALEKARLLVQLRDKIYHARRLQTEYDALPPEEKSLVDKLLEENAPEREFLQELITRVLGGSMSPEDVDREMEARFERRGETMVDDAGPKGE